MQFIPYRSAGPASQDLLAGNIDMMMDTAATSGGHVRSGLLKAFALASNKRSTAVPDVPSVDEAGLPGIYFYFWHALWVPKGTPADVIGTLNSAMMQVLADPTVKAKFAELGLDVASREQQTPAGLAAFQKGEIEKWWPIIKDANLKAE